MINCIYRMTWCFMYGWRSWATIIRVISLVKRFMFIIWLWFYRWLVHNVRMVVTKMVSLLVWITGGLNLVRPLAMMVYVLHWGIDVVLQVLRDRANPTEKCNSSSRPHGVNYEMITLNIIYYIYKVSSWYSCYLTKYLILCYYL